jgi:hypothetical protein
MKDWQYLAMVIAVCAVGIGWYLGNLCILIVGRLDALLEKITEFEEKWDEAELWKSN